MTEARSVRPRRGWVLANVIGGTVILVGLSIALLGLPGSGSSPADSAAKSLTPSAGTRPTCTQFQRMVGECAAPTTTTSTTATPTTQPASGSSGSGAGGTTYTYTTPGASGTRPATAPAAAAPAPPADASVPALSPTVAADPASCSGSTPPIGAPAGSWHCTFDDEFNGTSLDPSNWSAMTTYGSNYRTGPVGHQVCYVNSPNVISESGGYLDLSIVQLQQPISCPGVYPSDGSTDIEGGEVISYQLFSQQYGYFEARAAMPSSNVGGLQDTLWLYPENETLYGPWPDSGEIDFGQWYSVYPNNDFPDNVFPGMHSDPNAETNTCAIAGQSPAGQFHTYAVSWTPTTITEYYDGVACLTDTYAPYVTSPDTAPEPFNQPFFIALTAALGAGNADEYHQGQTPLPATMQVDWMRVWQYGS